MAGSIGWTSLRGNDKYTLLKDLKLDDILPTERGAATRALWTKFLHVYDKANVHRTLTEAEIVDVEVRARTTHSIRPATLCLSCLQTSARDFVRSYIAPPTGTEGAPDYTPGMYPGATVTPYMHALSEHLGAHLRTCARFGIPLTNFSTEPVEFKNHQHIKFFFHHTTQGGGKMGKSPILFTMEKENRQLYQPPALPPRHTRRHRIRKIKK